MNMQSPPGKPSTQVSHLHHCRIVSQHSVDYLHPLPHYSFRITAKDTLFSHISIDILGLYIPPWSGKIFKFMVFRFLENAKLLFIINRNYSFPFGKLSSIFQQEGMTMVRLWYLSNIISVILIITPLKNTLQQF